MKIGEGGREGAFLSSIGGFALLFRLVFLLLLPRLGIDPLGNPDAVQYDQLARALSEGRGYAPDARSATEALFRPPLYPAFLAGCYSIAGRSIALILGLQAVFGAASAAMIGILARRRFGAAAGWVAGAIAAVHPLLILPGGELLTESLFVALYLGGILFFSSALEERGRIGARHALPAGVLLGLAVLARPTPLIALPVLAVGLAWAGERPFGLRAFLRGGAFLGAALLSIAPWIIGAHARHGVWVPVATTGEFTLYLGNSNGWAERVFLNGESPDGQDWDMEKYREIRTTAPGEFASKARAIIREDPGRFARLTAVRAERFLKLLPEGKGSAVRRLLGLAGYTLLFPIGIAGLLFAMKRRDRLAIILFPVFAMMVAIHAVSIPSIRYRIALIDSVLPVFAGALIAGLIAAKRLRDRGRSGAESSPPSPPR